MPLTEDQFTRSQIAFVDAYVGNGMDREKAERTAKLAPRAGYRLLGLPKIQKRIVEIQNGRIVGDLLPKAVNRLESVLDNDNAPAAAHVKSATYVIDWANKTGEELNQIGSHEWDLDKLNAEIQRLEEAASSVAQDVTPNVIEGEIVNIFD